MKFAVVIVEAGFTTGLPGSACLFSKYTLSSLNNPAYTISEGFPETLPAGAV